MYMYTPLSYNWKGTYFSESRNPSHVSQNFQDSPKFVLESQFCPFNFNFRAAPLEYIAIQLHIMISNDPLFNLHWIANLFHSFYICITAHIFFSIFIYPHHFRTHYPVNIGTRNKYFSLDFPPPQPSSCLLLVSTEHAPRIVTFGLAPPQYLLA